MFPFWDVAIAPILDAVAPQRVVEIGALRGENTVQLFERLGPTSDLHVIDPDPQFDPSDHERDFPGRYHFHRALSLDVLPELPPMDVALVDGDHNWYTVYNELRALAATAAAHDQLLPVLLLHDVCWPYGRRDLYYDPDTIPAEHRQPYAQRGIRRGKSELAKGAGGLNPTMYNATHEGGPRNGVMTGLDDFVAEHPEPLRVLVLPIYFGLAIVVEQRRLEAQPELAAVLDHLESSLGKDDLLELAEDTRLRAMLFQHNVFYRDERLLTEATERYLAVVVDALLDEHYLENEARIDHLLDCLERGSAPVDDLLRDPLRRMKDKVRRLRAAHRSGRYPADDEALPAYFPWTAMGRTRLEHLRSRLDEVRTGGVAGDVVEVGAGRGGGGVLARAYLEAWRMPGPTVWVLDEFRSTPADDDLGTGAPDGEGDDDLGTGAVLAPGSLPRGFPALLADLNVVRDAYDRFGLLDDRVRFLQGPFDDTLTELPAEAIALLRIGEGAGAAAGAVLDALYDRVPVGGSVVIEELGDPACRRAVEDFRARRGLDEPLERIDWTAGGWRKAADRPADPDATPVPVDRPAGAGLPSHPPLAPPAPPKARDLSVVIVFYNMRREAERSLYSLSRAYQQGIDDLDYEVVVVDNGSAPDQRLDAAYVRSFGPEFRFIAMDDEAEPSPVRALNRGIAASTGEHVALMIDGAHVLTPGVLRYGMLGLRTYGPAIVGAQQWYVGPGQQGDAMDDGYDQPFEDRLFQEIGWPSDGYRLFDIGHFIGDRDWLDGLWESNCLFAPRSLLEQVGGFDESFDMPGGGYANLDIYERLGSSPEVTAVTMLGEGSFHQLHGGTTTNQELHERGRRLESYAAHYLDQRGRSFRGLDKPMHYIGTMTWEACRTRPRRRVAPAFFDRAAPDDPDGMPTEPTPVPDELRTQIIESVWRNLRWKETSWLGQRVGRPATDLFVYQELISEIRPDWIVETGTGTGGRALFLASICELLGHGQVVSIDKRISPKVPQHPRITYLQGRSFEPSVAAEVAELVGDDPRALVVLGSCGRRLRTIKEFEAYKPLVPVGSYIVIEDTIVNGRPVWPAFGLGPGEAAKQLVEMHRDFVADITLERYVLTFNARGFLKRVK